MGSGGLLDRRKPTEVGNVWNCNWTTATRMMMRRMMMRRLMMMMMRRIRMVIVSFSDGARKTSIQNALNLDKCIDTICPDLCVYMII